MPLDLDFIRQQYPVFQNSDYADWAFFENAGGSYVPKQVSSRLQRFFTDYKVQPYGQYAPSIAAGKAMDEGYQCIADLINASVDDITIAPSTSLNTYVLAQAIAPMLKPGDEVIVSNQDHEANIGSWRRLADKGVVIKEWGVDQQSGELDCDDLAKLINAKTKLICFTMCSNIIGSVNDVARVCELAKSVGAWTVADAVAYAPHHAVDINKLGVDFYLFSTYKTFATHQGVFWVNPACQKKLTPQCHYFNADIPRYRLNPTGPMHAEIAALGGLHEYFRVLHAHHFDKAVPSLHKTTGLKTRGLKTTGLHEIVQDLFPLFAEHEALLANQVLDCLNQLPARVLGKTVAENGTRAATISFIPKNIRPSDLVDRLAEQKIAVRHGNFYAIRCLQAMNVDDVKQGVVRISLVHYNTEMEVAKLCVLLGEYLAD